MPNEGRTTAMSTLMRTKELTDALSHKSVIEKQKSSIEKLRQQNAKLKEDLLLENKFSVTPSNPGATVLINKLQDEADLFTRKIQLEKRKVLLLEQQLHKVQSMLGTSRTTMGGINNAKEKQQELAKAIKLLENRLEQQYIKYNEAVTCNKGLREQIDNLRRERMMFEAINSNLDKELLRIKRAMADTIAAANDAHAAKERAQQESANLKLQAEREHASFEEEWRQLTLIIEEDKHQRDMQRAADMAERERRTQELLHSSEAGAIPVKKKTTRNTWQIGMNRVMAQNESQEKVQLFQEAFDKIAAATDILDIDELVKAFVDAEDTNFTLFNYVNEVNTEVEKLEDNICGVRKEIDAYSSKSAAVDDAAAAQAGGAMGRLLSSETRAAAYERRLHNALDMVSTLGNGISLLFDEIGCNTAPVQALLGGEGMTPDNMLAYLGIVEQRAKELLQAYAVSKGAQGAQLQELLLAQPVPPPAVRITIDPPSSTDHAPSAAAAAAAATMAATGGATSSSMLASTALSGTGLHGEGEEELDVAPEDVPLSTAALRARVNRHLDALLERSLKVKPAAVTAGTKAKGRTAQPVC